MWLVQEELILKKPITIALADDHEIIRQGLSALLSVKPHFQIVAETGRGADVVAMVAKYRPDVLVLDISMPDVSGLDVLRRLAVAANTARVVLFTMHSQPQYVKTAINAGAAGYVAKDNGIDVLTEAIEAAARGDRYIDESIVGFFMDDRTQQTSPAHGGIYADLSVREREVFSLAAAGLKNPEIASRLSISPRTVETHRGNIHRKLGLKSRADETRYAIEHGILGLVQPLAGV